MKGPNKKNETYKETFKKGLYYHDRDLVAGWADNDDVWLNILNAGCNDDGTEFVTIKFNNINAVIPYAQKFRDKVNPPNKKKSNKNKQ